MTHQSIYHPLADRDSDVVKEALTRRCEVCKAQKNADCTSIIDGKAVPGRIVHYARATA